MIDTDKYINKYVKKSMPLFKYIHPNFVTLTGFFINLFIYHYYFINKNIKILGILIIIRVLMDNLDGMVARTYNKSSNFGGQFDLLSGYILHYLLIYGILQYFRFKKVNSNCITIFLLICLFLSHINTNSISKHENMNDDVFNGFIRNNTYIFNIILILFLLKLA